ncbi:16S rRNA processing protein RimM [Clostridium argentinense CDC 2741]|uniref:Ribosome maturation factor RimM n=1 Tax=Clostridium argentinense CDC 2741 TaxID=1418104 RepID=A0A0C1R1G5_9CLOT|nr:ribosome maturation factor RimM [Clostridium argentinense]ARC85678.1 16S rRNA processing protein RimM [Clostridium argentinense]KIE47232.1 16S rRNA processing protein RimM [Clostridium argentinense CDC 2741]NFF40798.1 16S rRNA processing protein RimM [Clostridium argentinense]NFP50730.1 16S rRNA processing protein RimM [Clostridium argentinense]NFP73113.1 16S rRNA processing protein RimM [Clostridium argentinense]
MKEFMSIGQITKPHGVKGEVKVFSLTDSLEEFTALKKVYIDGVERKITSCKLQTDRAILKIEGIDSMDEAEKYRNKYLKIHREDAKELPEDSYYIADLIDCKVFDTEGEELGTVYDVIETGSNDVYWVKGKKEVLIPALKDIVVKVDIENNEIIIKPVNVWSE